MKPCIINSGDRYGKATILREGSPKRFPSGETKRRFVCLCDCGKEFTTYIAHLRSGNTTSCGCVHTSYCTSHGMFGSKIYNIWRSMKNRCKSPTGKWYHRYGGRGIKVSDEWQSFETFYKDMGDAPEGMSIDRIDNEKGYSKENCRWATAKQQARNTGRNRLITYKGKTQCLTELAEKYKIDCELLRGRVRRNWNIDKAITTPNGTRINCV